MAKKSKDIKYYEAVGRRKEAIARVRLYIPGKDNTVTLGASDNKQGLLKLKTGEIFVNKKPISELFPALYEKARYLMPFKLTNNEERFATSIMVQGGGRNSQLEAIIHGLARAINLIDREAYRPALKKNGLLVRDPRTRERRKIGTGGKARRAKQSPKR